LPSRTSSIRVYTLIWLSTNRGELQTAITDTGLKELAALKNLTKLDLSYTKVTDVGVTELQLALPKCEISRAAVGVCLAPARHFHIPI
jgi:hypothetical protein